MARYTAQAFSGKVFNSTRSSNERQGHGQLKLKLSVCLACQCNGLALDIDRIYSIASCISRVVPRSKLIIRPISPAVSTKDRENDVGVLYWLLLCRLSRHQYS